MKSVIQKIKLGDDSMFALDLTNPNVQLKIEPSNASAIKGYEHPKNFPFCCDKHKKIFDFITEWFDEFPYCCKPHKKLADNNIIKKKDYKGLPNKIINCISYTEHFIEQRYKNKDWYNDITNYIDYINESFGQPAIGADQYYHFIINYISQQNNPLSDTQKKKLLKYLEPNTNKKSLDDAIILFKIYSKWLELFPFELSYFSKLKKYFSAKLPLTEEKAIYNPYTGKSKAKFTSKENLLNVLAERTKYLLTQVSGVKLRKAGLLKTTNQIIDKEIEILNESNELELKELNISKNDNSKKYRKILNKWFKNQEKYFEKLFIIIEKQERILKESNQETKKSNKTKTIPNSFTYINIAKNYTAISDVYSSLKGIFIDNDTKLKNFKKIFANKLPETPVIWIHDKNSLYYFIKLLFDRALINDIQNKWKVTCNIFVDENKNKFELKNFGRQSKPSKETCKLLDRIINDL